MLYNPLNAFLEKTRLLFQRRVKDGQLAVLGDGTGRVEVPDRPGYVYIRYPGTPDANGNATYSSPGMARASGAAFSNYEGASVYVAIGYNNELEVVSANYQSLDQAGIDTRTLNPLHQQSKWVYLWQLTIGLCTAVATTVNNSFLVTIKNHLVYVGNVFQFFETGAQADKIDLSAYVPAVDMQCYAAVWVDTYTNAAEVTTSTAQSLFSTLDDSDINEVVTLRPPDAMPYKIFWLANDQGTVTIQAANDIDLRQFLNTPPLFGFPNPVTYRERIQPDRQQVFTGTLVVTGTLEVLGALIGVSASGSGGGSGGGVTSVTASSPLSSSGGTTPNISHDTSGAVAGTYTKPAFTVNNTGHITQLTNGVTGMVAAVRLATAAALPSCTYANGSSGVGATLTATANGGLTVDGTAVILNNRILVKNQASALENGIYRVTDTGGAFTPFELTRTTDADSSDEIVNSMVAVSVGTVNQGALYFNINLTALTVGTNDINYYTIVPATIGAANTALSNLASVAINTSLISDTDVTDDLGSSASKWLTLFSRFAVFEDTSDPSTPASGDLTEYAKAVGNGSAKFQIDDSGAIAQITPMMAILADSKATNTAGGSSSATTYNARDLQTEVSDPYALVSISSNQFTPVAGDYIIFAMSAFRAASAAATGARERLYNVTGGASVAEGVNFITNADGGGYAYLNHRFTANGTDAYRLDTYTSAARATVGLGQAFNTGTNEIYTLLILWKVK